MRLENLHQENFRGTPAPGVPTRQRNLNRQLEQGPWTRKPGPGQLDQETWNITVMEICIMAVQLRPRGRPPGSPPVHTLRQCGLCRYAPEGAHLGAPRSIREYPGSHTALLSVRNWQGGRGVLTPSTAHWSRRPQLPTLSSRGGRRPHDRLYLGKEIYMFIYRRGTIPPAGI